MYSKFLKSLLKKSSSLILSYEKLAFKKIRSIKSLKFSLTPLKSKRTSTLYFKFIQIQNLLLL